MPPSCTNRPQRQRETPRGTDVLPQARHGAAAQQRPVLHPVVLAGGALRMRTGGDGSTAWARPSPSVSPTVITTRWDWASTSRPATSSGGLSPRGFRGRAARLSTARRRSRRNSSPCRSWAADVQRLHFTLDVNGERRHERRHGGDALHGRPDHRHGVAVHDPAHGRPALHRNASRRGAPSARRHTARCARRTRTVKFRASDEP